MLLDNGISPDNINWIDPTFKVGDMGAKWYQVPSNTKVELFTKFLLRCRSFEINTAPHFPLFDFSPHENCDLKQVVEPLRWVTNSLRKKVHSFEDTGVNITKNAGQYTINLLTNTRITSDKVILAMGAEEKSKLYSEIAMVPLDIALNPNKLRSQVDSNDVVAVFGSSHSAVLAMKFLLEAGVKKVINFYRSPLCYAVFYADWILYDNTGLKGVAAQWAKNNMEDNIPANLERIISNDANVAQYLPLANKAVYAIGFDKRSIMLNDQTINDYNTLTGQIEQNIYGVGIAFPEHVTDKAGNTEANVGLWKFMNFIDRNMPNWIAS
jgi:hypothetical protein